MELSKGILEGAEGLPLALKNIFLDIACLFIGHEEEEVVRILETCYEVVNDNIDRLKKRWDMGREIAYNNSPRKPEEHSRLWVSKEICDVLRRLKGTEAIEGIISHNDLCSQHAQEETSFCTEAFKSMSNLRFLYLNKVKLTGSFKQTFEDVTWLCWKFCPLNCLPSEFLPQKLVILALPRSKLRTMWEVPQNFQESNSLNMPASLNFTTIPKFEFLETLNLEGSESLEEIYISSRSFKGLVSLNLCGCVSLRSLGETICDLKALKVLNIGKCQTLEALPTKLGDIDSLEVLNAEGLTILKLPDSIGRLSKLVELKLRCNTNLKTLPDTICDLSGLKILDIGYCEKLEVLPRELGNIKSLEELKAEGLTVLEIPNSIRHLSKLVELRLRCNKKLNTLPDAICDLSALKILDIGYCQGLRALPRELGNIKTLKELNAEGLMVSTLPDSIGYLSKLVVLRLSYNENLKMLPKTIRHMSSLEILDICRRQKLVKLARSSGSTLSKRILEIKASVVASETVSIPQPSGVSSWCKNPQNLDLKDCGRLVSIAELPPNLKRISADGCLSIESISNLCDLKQLEILNLTGCSGLKEIQGLEKLTSIKILHLTGCSSALLACVFTKRLLQIFSGFGHQVRIYTSEFPKWIEKSSHLASKVYSDLQPDMSSVFGGTVLCFKVSKTNSFTYSIKSTTGDCTWSDRSYNSYRKSLMILIPRSIFSIENGDVRIEATSEDAEIHGIHLLYKMVDEYDHTPMNREEVVLLNS
ncbi:TMV resistance protein N-like [Apium graveolens]